MARIVLITGANRGIGRELAAQLAADGDTVLLTARNERSRGQAASEIGGDVHPIQLDASDQASIDAAAKKVEAEHGRVDVLVNNVGGLFGYDQQPSTVGPRQGAGRAGDQPVQQVAHHPGVPAAGAQVRRTAASSTSPARLVRSPAMGAHTSAYSASKAALNAFTAASGRGAGRRGHHRPRRVARLDSHRPRWRGRPPRSRGRGQHQARREPARRCGHRRLLPGRRSSSLVTPRAQGQDTEAVLTLRLSS